MTENVQYLYTIKPTRREMLSEGPTAEESRAIEEHFSYLKVLTERRIVILAGRTLNDDETGFGIIIFEAQSEAAALEVMNNDPAVHKGVMKARLYPYRIALMRDG